MNDFEFGRVTANQMAQEERLKRLEDKVDTIYDIVTKAQGGWKVMVGIGSLGATIGAIVAKVFSS